MELLIVRHGIAVDRGTEGLSDAERPLTEEGREKFTEAARGLAKILARPDVLLSSPLVRARQTAEIAAKAWKKANVTIDRRLAGGNVDGILEAVHDHATRDLVAVFGHEPDVSDLLARLIGARHPDRVGFKKGAAALVDMGDRPGQSGQLVWFLSQKVLRQLV